MAVRYWLVVGGLAAILAASLLTYLKTSREQTAQTVSVGSSSKTGSTFPAERSRDENLAMIEVVIPVSATEVLASVNGRELGLADLVPWSLNQTNPAPQFSPESYKYLLDRAINRELIFQAAKAQNVGLDDSQRMQLAEFCQQRQSHEPGLTQPLNSDPAQADFEKRDVEAFMLQTALLAKTGASPNVNTTEVQEFYADHAAEFGGLPADETARESAWGKIDFQIRTRLAPLKREQFQRQLALYMDQIKANAYITYH
jgi:hypothetical protein